MTHSPAGGSPVQISVVMPSYNQARFIEEAVRSVLEQQGVELELLVLDPGSTDGSRELLLRLREEYGDRLRLVFAPDAGQSDAVNRGMALAKGRVLGWLNSDDRLAPGALAQAVALLDHEQPAWLYGTVAMIDGTGAPISSLIVRYKTWRGRRFSFNQLLTENFISQMGVFWNRALWEQAGELDLRKDLDMDYDLWLRFAKVVEPTVLLGRLADFRVHGLAKGSCRTGEQLDAAYATALSHAAGQGLVAQLAVLIHRLFSLRTRLLYWYLKPS